MANDAELIALTAEITSSFVSNNRLAAQEVAGVIERVHKALSSLGAPAVEVVHKRPQPAVSIRKSVQPDFLVDLFTGRKLKTLKRVIARQHGMTPAEYRTYWGLPDSYPMIAPNYSEMRSAIAKTSGLGRREASN